MPAPTPEQLGPFAGLAGTWEGTKGLDVSYHNEDSEIGDTPYRERVTLSPFGPVDNGNQHLFGLDYRMAAWRNDEENPFHTEVGYWLWDGELKQVMRCFMVPRGSTILAGGTCEPDAKNFNLEATCGQETYGILSNPYLAEKARTSKYTCTITVEGNTWLYDETTQYKHAIGGDIAHTDRNVLRKVD